MAKQKVKDHPNLVRDVHSKALLNGDRAGYAAARQRKILARKKDAEIETMQADMKSMQKQIDSLLKLLKSGN